MILLDTNVISALMAAETQVVGWLDAQPTHEIWLSSITVFEVELGLALLPAGRRRVALQLAFDALLADELAQRIAPFDVPAASQAAQLAARRQRAGRPVDVRDTQIAGIAIARQATLATRNVRHFQDLPGPVVNPWASVVG